MQAGRLGRGRGEVPQGSRLATWGGGSSSQPRRRSCPRRPSLIISAASGTGGEGRRAEAVKNVGSPGCAGRGDGGALVPPGHWVGQRHNTCCSRLPLPSPPRLRAPLPSRASGLRGGQLVPAAGAPARRLRVAAEERRELTSREAEAVFELLRRGSAATASPGGGVSGAPPVPTVTSLPAPGGHAPRRRRRSVAAKPAMQVPGGVPRRAGCGSPRHGRATCWLPTREEREGKFPPSGSLLPLWQVARKPLPRLSGGWGWGVEAKKGSPWGKES